MWEAGMLEEGESTAAAAASSETSELPGVKLNMEFHNSASISDLCLGSEPEILKVEDEEISAIMKIENSGPINGRKCGIFKGIQQESEMKFRDMKF